MNSEEIKKMAKKFGADLIGIAEIAKFASLPPDKHPSSIFPECKSVIVLARRILRGSLRGVEEGTNFSSTYGTFGFRWLEDNFIAQTTYDLTCWLEENGVEAVPLFAYFEEGMPKGVPVCPEKPCPNVIVDFEYAAQVAGLGEIGYGGFFLTKEFGPRQRFAMILTDFQFEADQSHKKSICGDCMACVFACPLKAYQYAKEKIKMIDDFSIKYLEPDYELCRVCKNGATVQPGKGARPDRLGAACVRACIVQLEKNGKCINNFKNPFRKRLPWALDIIGRPLDENSEDASNIGCGKKYI
ncbi:MAG TPA: hypothetical protein P5270_05095 [Victivallales bacterium]|nr:hypothetical protein [Victivallales bacterium]HRR28719.1 hypothetical protein [Victivallales bacterium]HRU00883.1 hypothetical protein [Victivallales bacterium]